MSCYNENQLFDYINKETSADDYSLIKEHLNECVYCNYIYKNKLKEINSLKECLHEFDQQSIHIPEFKFPEKSEIRAPKRISPLIIKWSIAASLLFLISISIILNSTKKSALIDLEYIQMKESNIIYNMNDSWHNQDLIFTETNTETGITKVFLSSEI